MNIIIGGSGFVGSRLISQLGIESCVNIYKNPSPFYDDITKIADIRDSKKINFSKEYKAVVLLAAEHRDDVTPISLYYDVNVEGTKNILNEMDRVGIKNLIFTSSVAVYGLNKKEPCENHILDPFNHYWKSKLKAEQVIIDWYKRNPDKKCVTIIRPTVIFGERNRGNVYNLLNQISSGHFLMVGKGNNKKSMAYVGNIVEFIKKRLEISEPGYYVFNYADKPDYNMNELVCLIEKKFNIKISKLKIPYFLGMFVGFCFDLISKISRKKFNISSVRVKKFCATTQFDASKVHESFNPPFTLEEGLDRTLDFEFFQKKDDDILFYSE